MQPPPSSPPQWSPDGQWWWDGAQWRPRSDAIAPAAPIYAQPSLPPGYPMPAGGYPMPAPVFQMPPPIVLQPSPGLRFFLLVVLAISGFLLFLPFLAGLVAVTSGSDKTTQGFLFFAFLTVVFALQVVAFVGVAIRARWSRWVAMIAGIGMMLTDIGIVLAIPIWIAAARAPDLTKKAPAP